MAWNRDELAARAARELRDGYYVNLGIGIPTLVANFVPKGMKVVLQSENGMLGMGPFPYEDEVDPDLINAGKQTITQLPISSYFSSSDSFAMIRGGHLDLALLGAFEVSAEGDLANWTTEDPEWPPGVGGAMDLAAGAREVRVLMEHTTREGAPRLRRSCSYPLTAPRVVRRVYTNLAVIDVGGEGMVVREMLPGMTVSDLQAVSEPPLALAKDWRTLEAPAV